MSQDEFFQFIQGKKGKWELIDGEAVLVESVNQRGSVIAGNILTSLQSQLRGQICRATAADTGVSTLLDTVRYPDVVVDRGRRGDHTALATEPAIVVEIISPTTRVFDSHRKVFEYKSKEEVANVLLIDTESKCILLHCRRVHGWSETMYVDPDDSIVFSEIGAILALRDVYDGLQFTPNQLR